VLYEDAELGFTILAHGYTGAKSSNPHDHGPSWAIYGQADGETIMTDWECLARPSETAPGKAKHIKDYVMKPGDAYLYDIGVLHSPAQKLDAPAAYRGHQHGQGEAQAVRGGAGRGRGGVAPPALA